MVRKILIIFALIIAAFPYLGFSDTADLVVTTVFSLLIALALILGRKPKTIKTTPSVVVPEIKVEAPIITNRPQEMKVNHFENEQSHTVPFVSNSNNPEVLEVNNEKIEIKEEPVVSSEIVIPAKKPRLPRRKIATKESPVELMVSSDVEMKNESPVIVDDVLTIRRRQKKGIDNTILAHEDSVLPADIPTSK